MSYLNTCTIKNGSYDQDFTTYKCDITGNEIPENFPHFSFCENKFHISEEGIEKLITDYGNSFEFKDRGIYPYFIENLKNLFTSTKKRSTYINKKLRAKVLLKYKHKCHYCGSKNKLEIDHIIPVSKGGKDLFSNLQVLCKTCNLKKGAK